MASLYCMYATFPPVFTFSGKNGVESFCLGHHLQRSWICKFIVCLFISWSIRAFRCKVIILSTSIAPQVVMISTYSRVRSGPRLFSSPIISISTPASSMIIIIILISIPTLTSIFKSPLGVLSVVWSHITLSIVIWVITTPIT